MLKKYAIQLINITFILLLPGLNQLLAQVPVTSYTSPQTYQAGTAVTSLSPSTTGAIAVNGQTSTFAGNGTAGSTDGTGIAASFNQPLGAATDAFGNIYIAEAGTHIIRKITPGGVVSIFAGSYFAGYTDGQGTAASFYHPVGLTVDGAGNIYVADEDNHVIRKITPSGLVTTLAGNGTQGNTDGTGTAARFYYPCGVTVDAGGNVYVADTYNNKIRKITATGAVTTIAGSGAVGAADNANGLLATFNQPFSIVLDATSSILYVTDRSNHKIRKIMIATGAVTTFAGSGTAAFANGSGIAASFNAPTGLAADGQGNIYVADENNNMIRAITAGGLVSTLSGTGTANSTNGVGATATFNLPFGLAVDKGGNLYVGDYNNKLIRKVAYSSYSINPMISAGLSFNVGTGVINGTPAAVLPAISYIINSYNGYGKSADASLSITIAAGSPPNFNQDKNYIAEYTPRVDGILSSADVYTASSDKIREESSVEYFDGLGRPLQTVQVKASFLGRDIVQPVIYDPYGRESTKYLPYAQTTGASDGSYKTDALTAGYGVDAFYNPAGIPTTQQQLAGGISHNTSPYSKIIFEPSPLGAVTEEGSPGNTWQPYLSNSGLSRTNRKDYAANDNTDITNVATTFKVMLYKVSIAATDGTRTLVNAGTTAYATGQLYVTIDKDANWQSADLRVGTVQTFKDKEGNVILKRTFNKKSDNSVEMLSTYYVYDDFGELAYILPPGALPDGGTISQTTLDFWCYQYHYDDRGRLVEKKLPGKGKEFFVYNSLNQLVMRQDANQRATADQQWTVSKYDALGRTVVSGLFIHLGSTAGMDYRASIQAAVTGNPNIWETRVTSGNGYNTAAGVYNAYPTMLNTTLAVTYYDNYDIPAFPAGFDKHTVAGISANTKGLPTASLVKIIDGTAGSSNMLWHVGYYNSYGQNSRSFDQHFKGGVVSINNYDELNNTYDFTGALKTSTRTNMINSGTNTLLQSVAVQLTYEYDHKGRKIHTWENINGNGTLGILVSSLKYNEVGQQVEKNLHSTDNGQTFVQGIDYRYNNRGWLKSINNSVFSNDVLTANTNDDTNDAFGMEFYYDDYATVGLKQYNGNLSSITWQSKKVAAASVAQIVQSYEYNYDRLNRLTTSNYTTAGLTGRYNEVLTYDVAGNVKTLSRYRDISSTATPIDQLVYTFDNGNNSSRLLTVADNSGNNEGQLSGTAVYTYDNNGNLWTDNKKQLTFAYNYLNLPYTVTKTGGTVLTYIYDANGRKLRKVMTGNNRDYISGIEYDNVGNLIFLATEEGRARPNGSSYFYDYALKDHLGNTRVLIGQDGVIGQQTDYYAFGLEMNRGVNVTPNPDNKYKYNGKEMQDDLSLNLYDFGARLYDPAIGRWTAMDPLAEKNTKHSPYNYVENNPLNLVDPDGMDAESEAADLKRVVDEAHVREAMFDVQVAASDALYAAIVSAENAANPGLGLGPTWASKGPFKVHQQANANGINRNGKAKNKKEADLREIEINGLNDGTDWADANEHQTGEFSFMHEMTDDAANNVDSKMKAIAFIRKYYSLGLVELKKGGDIRLAYMYLGIALHPLQDATSPVHAGWQVWTGKEWPTTEAWHAVQELFYPGVKSNLQNVTNQILDMFQRQHDLPEYWDVFSIVKGHD
jgi:RHS repeat-associated protein